MRTIKGAWWKLPNLENRIERPQNNSPYKYPQIRRDLLLQQTKLKQQRELDSKQKIEITIRQGREDTTKNQIQRDRGGMTKTMKRQIRIQKRQGRDPTKYSNRDLSPIKQPKDDELTILQSEIPSAQQQLHRGSALSALTMENIPEPLYLFHPNVMIHLLSN